MTLDSIFDNLIAGSVAIIGGAVTWTAKALIRHDAEIKILQREVAKNQDEMKATLERIEKSVGAQADFCRTMLIRGSHAPRDRDES